MDKEKSSYTQVIESSAIIIGALTFIAYIKQFFYYWCYDIDISNYISIEEVFTPFLDDLLLCIIIIVINISIPKALEKLFHAYNKRNSNSIERDLNKLEEYNDSRKNSLTEEISDLKKMKKYLLEMDELMNSKNDFTKEELEGFKNKQEYYRNRISEINSKLLLEENENIKIKNGIDNLKLRVSHFEKGTNIIMNIILGIILFFAISSLITSAIFAQSRIGEQKFLIIGFVLFAIFSSAFYLVKKYKMVIHLIENQPYIAVLSISLWVILLYSIGVIPLDIYMNDTEFKKRQYIFTIESKDFKTDSLTIYIGRTKEKLFIQNKHYERVDIYNTSEIKHESIVNLESN